ncbi:hypothetical protein CIRMBP1245_00291 [Enterococcus cecorum]|uniref:hypothetical protein n=1 Tax=Enterococcus cecorum TaxID=44008 RepID=UPI0006594DF0|nr:hypothetical protein [Enterococcus cecorum]KLO67511.1 hypothetical protein AA985_01015 [Enterococcus cecorum]CAI3253961.1 hypothetical protein CIRMBP1243_00064 [Enterococcus cecorum]CAI3254675.1 hypothetical protein CIRMBP1195_00052 [Enterococcus cecorum]CAI3254851.1 hypothetical protein CIRMBP1217_00051 [Enterococcus cecorum]CAI3257367.1 hypothetical protein CIRMBP1205_00086 [Enterococcus cecorum]
MVEQTYFVVRGIGKRVLRAMDEVLWTYSEILSNAQNRLILGFIVFGVGVGLGGGLIASSFIRIPDKNKKKQIVRRLQHEENQII